MKIKVLSAIVGDAIKCCYVHPVRFEMVFKEFSLGLSWDVFLNKNIPFDEEVVKSLTWDSLVFDSSIKELMVYTMKTGNKDNRGGGCGNITDLQDEEFEYTIKNPNGITLKDLTECVYRMKGSKYDWWYELYSGIKIDCDNVPGYISLEAKFDYGS